ncbi:MAG TPA: PstS family phosphate ABC transporter substrate-binding protein [Halomicronema sp.]
MKAGKKESSLRQGLMMFLLGGVLMLNSCAQQAKEEQTRPNLIKIDGSSTVFPITKAISEEFQKTSKDATEVSVGVSGTTAGFSKFCAGETDINNASRPILEKEMAACRNNNVAYIELPVAFDALTVVVNPQNTWANNMTIEELKKMWEPMAEGKIMKWNQIRSNWPDKPLNLYGAGEESGTFDYFTEAIVGKADASRKDYTASEDDNILVDKISKDPNAVGYFGLAYYEASANQLKAVGVDSGKGAVIPNRKTVESNEYQPLSRPLFIYVNLKSAQNNLKVKEFVNFYLQKAPLSVPAVGYIALPEEGYRLAFVHFQRGKVGTVFEGKAQLNLTLNELLRKQEKF